MAGLRYSLNRPNNHFESDGLPFRYSQLLASKNAKVNVEGVQYFVRQNPASLVEKLHYFEWVEVIEGEMFEPIA